MDRNGGLIIKTTSRVLAKLMAKTSKQGAQTSIMLATDPHVEFVTGEYYEHCKQSRVKNPMASNLFEQEKLWEICEGLVSDYL